MEHADDEQGQLGRWGTEESREATRKRTAEHLAAGRPEGELWYHEWRLDVGHGCYVADVDQIEWRKVTEGPMKGQQVPAAVLELTVPRVEGYWAGWCPHPNYLTAILDRYAGRDKSGYRLAYLAGRLGVPGYILLHDRERPPQHLWRYPYAPGPPRAPGKRWVQLTLAEHEAWLQALRPAEIWKAWKQQAS